MMNSEMCDGNNRFLHGMLEGICCVATTSKLTSLIRLDPVKIRVALPAADPPDNANDTTFQPRHPGQRAFSCACCGTENT
jgi:hypothetical protein